MAVTGNITTKFIDEKGVDLGKTLIEKDYLISVYPNLLNQFDTPMLMTCGANPYGSLGDNTITNRSSPVQTITYGANWKQVSCGYDSSTGIKTDGTLWTWGSNFIDGRSVASGQLGDNTTIDKSSPVQTIAFGTNWKQVSCFNDYMAAIKTDGTLWTWGRNNVGQLGDNTTTNRSSPVQTIAGGTNWKQVSCGDNHAAAIKTDGTLWIWGQGTDGQLGDNTAIARSSPVQTIAGGTNWTLVSCGNAISAAINKDGTLWMWGTNGNGSFGNNTTTSRSSPVQTATFGTKWKQVSCGDSHTAAIRTDGTLWCAGNNYYGSLGDNTQTNRSSQVQTITFGSNWKSVSCGRFHTAAIKTDGTLWLWGLNNNGRLGNNTTTNRSSPTQTILYGQNWKSVSCAKVMTAAIKDGDF